MSPNSEILSLLTICNDQKVCFQMFIKNVKSLYLYIFQQTVFIKKSTFPNSSNIKTDNGKDEHLQKVSLSINLIDDGIVICFNDEQS